MSWEESPSPLTDKAPKHQMAARIKDLLGFKQNSNKPYRLCEICAGEFPDERTYNMHLDLCAITHARQMKEHTFVFNQDLLNQLQAQREIFLVVHCRADKIKVTFRRSDFKRFETMIENMLCEINVRGHDLK